LKKNVRARAVGNYRTTRKKEIKEATMALADDRKKEYGRDKEIVKTDPQG